MPIYEYRCTRCGHELDALQKLSEAPLTVCPQCNESALVKKVSAAGFRLKGGGWYETDFKSGKKRNVAGESASSGTDGGTSGEGGKSSGEGTGKSSGSAGKSSEAGSGSTSSGSGAKGSSSASSDGG